MSIDTILSTLLFKINAAPNKPSAQLFVLITNILCTLVISREKEPSHLSRLYLILIANCDPN